MVAPGAGALATECAGIAEPIPSRIALRPTEGDSDKAIIPLVLADCNPATDPTQVRCDKVTAHEDDFRDSNLSEAFECAVRRVSDSDLLLEVTVKLAPDLRATDYQLITHLAAGDRRQRLPLTLGLAAAKISWEREKILLASVRRLPFENRFHKAAGRGTLHLRQTSEESVAHLRFPTEVTLVNEDDTTTGSLTVHPPTNPLTAGGEAKVELCLDGAPLGTSVGTLVVTSAQVEGGQIEIPIEVRRRWSWSLLGLLVAIGVAVGTWIRNRAQRQRTQLEHETRVDDFRDELQSRASALADQDLVEVHQAVASLLTSAANLTIAQIDDGIKNIKTLFEETKGEAESALAETRRVLSAHRAHLAAAAYRHLPAPFEAERIRAHGDLQQLSSPSLKTYHAVGAEVTKIAKRAAQHLHAAMTLQFAALDPLLAGFSNLASPILVREHERRGEAFTDLLNRLRDLRFAGDDKPLVELLPEVDKAAYDARQEAWDLAASLRDRGHSAGKIFARLDLQNPGAPDAFMHELQNFADSMDKASTADELLRLVSDRHLALSAALTHAILEQVKGRPLEAEIKASIEAGAFSEAMSKLLVELPAAPLTTHGGPPAPEIEMATLAEGLDAGAGQKMAWEAPVIVVPDGESLPVREPWIRRRSQRQLCAIRWAFNTVAFVLIVIAGLLALGESWTGTRMEILGALVWGFTADLGFDRAVELVAELREG